MQLPAAFAVPGQIIIPTAAQVSDKTAGAPLYVFRTDEG
jgi:hypothetical protein